MNWLAITPDSAHAVEALWGFALKETSGTDPATVLLRDGDDSGVGLPVNLAAGQSVFAAFPRNLPIPSRALYVDVVTGAVSGALIVSR